MRRLFFILILPVVLFGPSEIISAQTIQGFVLDDSTKKPVALANIGVLDTKYGTYSGEDGSFSIELSHGKDQPVLMVSAIGYKSVQLPLSETEFSDTLNVYLKTEEYDLGSFTVEAFRIKSKTIGNKRLPPKVNGFGFAAGASRTRFGKTIAVKVILNQMPPIRIDEIAIGILENPWKKARFRARVMSIHPETGVPDKNLSSTNQVAALTQKDGWVLFYFKEAPLIINSSEFFIVIENVDEKGQPWQSGQIASLFPVYLFNSISLSKQPVYLSNEGLQSWEKVKEDPVFRLTYSFE